MIPVGYIVFISLFAIPIDSTSGLAFLEEDYSITSADYFDPEEYQVGFGDHIWISFPGGVPFVRSEESVSIIVLPIGLDGILSVPGMRPISIDGLNLAELQTIIEDMVRSSYGSLAVTAGLARSASFEIPVTGQVAEPGIVTVNGLTRLSEAIKEAGGETAVAALSNILVVSSSGDSSFYNLHHFTMLGDMTSNPLMRRSTRIHLFVSEASIIVEGALSSVSDLDAERVSEPSASLDSRRAVLEYIPGETPGEALQRAGGITDQANVGALFVQRASEDGDRILLPFDAQSALSELRLQPGDRIVVPFAEKFISVVGQVQTPVSVAYSPGMPVSYYIGMAGGFNDAARQGALKLVFPDGETEDVEMNSIVPAGAMVDVPRVPIQFWQEYLAILTGIATVIISYQSLYN